MAFSVSLKCNETVHQIIWEMPLSQVMVLLPLVQGFYSGEQRMTKREKKITKKRMEILEKEYTNES